MRNKKTRPFRVGFFELTGRLPSLPHTRACSTIGAEGLNFRVRDGNGWDPLAKVTQKPISGSRKTPARVAGFALQKKLGL
jgi:hypothetical protein